MLVYLAGAVGHLPLEAEEFKTKALTVHHEPTSFYREAIDRMIDMVREADPALARGYRHRLLALARDHCVVSRHAPEYPLMAAKSALLVALDYR